MYNTDYSSTNDETEEVNFAKDDTTVTIRYTITKDTDIEDIETFTLTLSLTGATDTGGCAKIEPPGPSTVYILDRTG